MKGKTILIGLLFLAFVIGVILILTLFIPTLRRPVPPVPQVQVTMPSEQAQIPVEKPKPYVFERAYSLYDPFTSKALEVSKIQEQMELRNAEIELLKLELEKLRLQAQIDSMRKGMGAVIPVGRGVRALAVSGSSGKMKVLLDNGIEKRWLGEGENFSGYQVIFVGNNYVNLRAKDGKSLTISLGE